MLSIIETPTVFYMVVADLRSGYITPLLITPDESLALLVKDFLTKTPDYCDLHLDITKIYSEDLVRCITPKTKSTKFNPSNN